MKKLTLFLAFKLTFCAVFGQDYIEYYHLCNAADKAIYLEQHDIALNKLETAFSLVDYVHTHQYQKASQCAANINDYQKTYSFIKQSILNGNKKYFWKSKQFKKFRKSEYHKMLTDSLSIFKQKALVSKNQVYKSLIDSLHFVDQKIIRNNNKLKAYYNIDESSLPENRYDLDSTNLITLLELIDLYGFPSEQNIGVESYKKAVIIIHHNFRLEKNEKHHPIIIQALYEGKYLPRHFIGMYEQFNMWYKDQTFFTTWDKNLSKENLERVNANRLKFGLKGLSAFKLKRNGLSMNPIW